MTKLCALLTLAAVATGCATLEERLAKRVGCDSTKLKVTKELHVPAYHQYNFTCEAKKYTCRDAPFYSQCNEGDKVDEKAEKKKG
jgi:hypothetical protein